MLPSKWQSAAESRAYDDEVFRTAVQTAPGNVGRIRGKGVAYWNDWKYRDRSPSDRGLARADLQGANLTDIDLVGDFLVEADLSGACLRRAKMRYARLQRAKLARADLTEADLGAAHLEGADFTQANLDRAEVDASQRAFLESQKVENLATVRWR